MSAFIVVHHDGHRARVSLTLLSRLASTSRDETEQAIEELVRSGFLTPRADGEYDATLPGLVTR